MNSAGLSRLTGVLAGLVLVLLLAGWILPVFVTGSLQQFDFWAVWLGCMLLLALPFTLLEVALAKRSQTSPLAALPVLTREADVQPFWRSVGWLAIVAGGLLSGGLLFNAGQTLQTVLPGSGIANALPLIAMIIGAAASFLPRFITLIIALLAVLAATGINVLHSNMALWQWGSFSFKEWAAAVSLALVATGLGFGAYWQIAATQGRERASSWAVPLWLAQLAGGVLFAVAQAKPDPISQWLLLTAGIAAAAFVLSLLREQLKARQLGLVLQWFIPFAPVFVWMLPVAGLLKVITILLALLVCAVYAIFSGWLMKVSHLRKALNFQQEGIYNLWRVAVRLVIPLAIIVALVGLVMPA